MAGALAGRIKRPLHLQWPGVVAAAFFVLCLQAALVCVWRLLTLAREGIIFNIRAFAYVDVILGAIIAATLIVVATLGFTFLGETLRDRFDPRLRRDG